eukprot:GHVR01062149.1.p1 GENE.GHVR01062149.1~~GHVR01062149.1.p1  ORF type:complete len:162 (-),score=40.10 GHVR01062149.1:168-653(-)
MRLLLLILVVYMVLYGYCANNKVTKAYRTRRSYCIGSICGGVPDEENDGCVDECLSPTCYTATYAILPLEPGEIDRKRKGDFITCVKLEIDIERKHGRMNDFYNNKINKNNIINNIEGNIIGVTATGDTHQWGVGGVFAVMLSMVATVVLVLSLAFFLASD